MQSPLIALRFEVLIEFARSSAWTSIPLKCRHSQLSEASAFTVNNQSLLKVTYPKNTFVIEMLNKTEFKNRYYISDY